MHDHGPGPNGHQHPDQTSASGGDAPLLEPIDRKTFLRRTGVGVASVGAASLLVACGGDDDDSAASTTEGTPAQGGKGGEIASKYKGKTIGIAHYTTADEGEGAMAAALKEAVEKAGLDWEIKEADSQADPGKMQSVVRSFVTQKVDAIVDMVIPSRLIPAELQSAKDAGIPVFGLWTFSELDPLLAIDYTPLPAADEASLSGYMFSDLYRKHPKGDIRVALMDTDLDILQPRTKVLAGLNELYPRVKIVDRANVDLTDAVGSGTKIANAFLSKHRDLNAIWVNYPPAGVPAAAAVQSKNRSDDVKMYFHIAGKAGLQALGDKSNPIQAMVLVDLDYQSYKTVEFILRHLKGEELDRLVSYTDVVPMQTFTKDTAELASGDGVAFEAGWTHDRGAWKNALVESWAAAFAT